MASFLLLPPPLPGLSQPALCPFTLACHCYSHHLESVFISLSHQLSIYFKISSENICFPPTHTPLSISSLLLFISSSDFLQLWKNASDSLQKTALQRAVTVFDMKDCNLSGLKHLIWVVSTCSSIIPPWNDGSARKNINQEMRAFLTLKLPQMLRIISTWPVLPCSIAQDANPRSSLEVAVLNIFVNT